MAFHTNKKMKQLLIILFVCALCAGCKTQKIVQVDRVRTDTLVITKHERDSIYLKDSTNVHEWQRGDTVYVEVNRWRTEYRDRWRHDTIYKHRVDSVPVPCPVEVEVERKLTWWQRLRINIGGIAIGLLAIAVIAGIFRLKKRLLS